MGGYFEMELRRGHQPFPDALAFNSARSAFQALLRSRDIRKVFMPHFLCAVMPEAARSVGVQVVEYGLDDQLELVVVPELGESDALLYVDYFGLKTHYVRNVLAEHLRPHLIVDNSQALFAAPLNGVPTLYSPRKFVGVPDGGWLVNGPTGIEPPEPGAFIGRFDAVLGRLGDAPEAHYADFQKAEEALGLEGIRGMSRATARLLDSIDYDSVKTRRHSNFNRLHDALSAINHFSPAFGEHAGALCYPLLIENAACASAVREALLEQRVFVPCYWREVLQKPKTPPLERDMTERLLALPIDQRYGPLQMDRLASIIHQTLRTA
jgi:hypothetical protein